MAKMDETADAPLLVPPVVPPAGAAVGVAPVIVQPAAPAPPLKTLPSTEQAPPKAQQLTNFPLPKLMQSQ